MLNGSRGRIVDEAALIEAAQSRRIIAALDVYDREPLPADHSLRLAPNTVLTQHLGYGVRETWAVFYGQSIQNALAFLDGKPVRVTNPEALSVPSPANSVSRLGLTGLKRSYDIRLHWVSDTAPSEVVGPNLAHAVQDQLGLRLERKKGAVDFLVADHIEKLPAEN